jgi:adenosylhomocysteine nucleosidase
LILVFYAFAREVAAFKRRIVNPTPLVHKDLRGFHAIGGGKEFSVVGHGIGRRRATETARRAFDLIPGAELAIGTGVVGALASGLKPGDLILAERILASRADGEIAEQVIAFDQAHLGAIGRSLSAAGIRFLTGAILTTDRVLTVAEKRAAKDRDGAIAVDMESSAIAVEAAARRLPFIVLRAVLDEVDDEVAGAEAMADELGNVKPLAATAYLVRNPGAVLKIPRMIRNLSLATTAIADALEAIAYDGKAPARNSGKRR